MGAAFSSFLEGIANLFGGKPEPSNDTLAQIEENLASKADEERAVMRQALQQLAVYGQQAEEQRAASEHLAKELAAMRQAEEQLAVYRQQAEEQRVASERLAKELAASKRIAEEQLAASKRQSEEEVAVVRHRAEAARLKGEADRLAFEQHVAEQHQVELAASKRTTEAEFEAYRRHAEAELDAKLRAEEDRIKESQQRAEEQHEAELAAAKLRAEELAATIRRGEEELAAMTLKAEDDQVASQQRERAAVKAAEDAKIALQRGIRPVEWPTKEQYDLAMQRIKYDPEKLHIAVCGLSGSGKSSLVNAFRGLYNRDLDSAKVGVTETTSEIGRYPDPRKDYPFSRFVWYDIPGAGTLSVRDWQYFNDQGLFVFDFLIVAYDVRFTSIDVGIIENCNRFRIPVFIVRSKADQHILNMMQSEGDELRQGDQRYDEMYEEKKSKFVLETRENFEEQIGKMKDASKKRELELDRSDSTYVIESHFQSSYQEWLSKQVLYIVSAYSIIRFLRASSLKRDSKPVTDPKIIDEVTLFEGLLSAGASRRYSGRGSTGNETLSKKKFLDGFWNVAPTKLALHM